MKQCMHRRESASLHSFSTSPRAIVVLLALLVAFIPQKCETFHISVPRICPFSPILLNHKARVYHGPALLSLRAEFDTESADLFGYAYFFGGKESAPVHPKPTPQPISDKSTVTFEDVLKANARLDGNIKLTSCLQHPDFTKMTGCNLFLKKEYEQYTGAFKERGARNALLELLEESEASGVDLRKKGIVAASAGNHALGLSYHGGLLRIPVTVVMPKTASMAKVNKCRNLGANVILHGSTFGDTKEFAMSSPDFKGVPYIDPFNNPAVIAGAGSIGIEILTQVKDVDVIVVPVGGGGLIAGISLAVKHLSPNVRVIGAEPANAASMHAAFEAGAPERVTVTYTVADGLSVPIVGDLSFAIARQHVDKIVKVQEELIPLALLRMVEQERAVVEGAAATGLAAVLPGGPLDTEDMKGKNVVVVLGGGNIDSSMLGRIIERGLAEDRRLVRFKAGVADVPGKLSELADEIGRTGANIKEIFHERAWTKGPLNMLNVQVVVELEGADHERRVRDILSQKYALEWSLPNSEPDI